MITVSPGNSLINKTRYDNSLINWAPGRAKQYYVMSWNPYKHIHQLIHKFLVSPGHQLRPAGSRPLSNKSSILLSLWPLRTESTEQHRFTWLYTQALSRCTINMSNQGNQWFDLGIIWADLQRFYIKAIFEFGASCVEERVSLANWLQ